MNAPVKSENLAARRAAGLPPLNRGAFFRISRMLHAYLSAFAFLALIFFSATGILLNHPEWFENYVPAQQNHTVALAPVELAAAKAAPDQGRALAMAVGKKTPLVGAFASGDVQGSQALIRLEGPKGSSDIDVNLTTGQAEVRVAKASLTGIIQDLHRGKNSGAAWRVVIDASAYIVIALSLIGYILFFSLRFRLKTSLALTAASLAILAAIAVWLVP